MYADRFALSWTVAKRPVAAAAASERRASLSDTGASGGFNIDLSSVLDAALGPPPTATATATATSVSRTGSVVGAGAGQRASAGLTDVAIEERARATALVFQNAAGAAGAGAGAGNGDGDGDGDDDDDDVIVPFHEAAGAAMMTARNITPSFRGPIPTGTPGDSHSDARPTSASARARRTGAQGSAMGTTHLPSLHAPRPATASAPASAATTARRGSVSSRQSISVGSRRGSRMGIAALEKEIQHVGKVRVAGERTRNNAHILTPPPHPTHPHTPHTHTPTQPVHNHTPTRRPPCARTAT